MVPLALKPWRSRIAPLRAPEPEHPRGDAASAVRSQLVRFTGFPRQRSHGLPLGSQRPARQPLPARGAEGAPAPRVGSRCASAARSGEQSAPSPGAPPPGSAWRQGFRKREVGTSGQCRWLRRRVRSEGACGRPRDAFEQGEDCSSDTRPEAPATFSCGSARERCVLLRNGMPSSGFLPFVFNRQTPSLSVPKA